MAPIMDTEMDLIELLATIDLIENTLVILPTNHVCTSQDQHAFIYEGNHPTIKMEYYTTNAVFDHLDEINDGEDPFPIYRKCMFCKETIVRPF